MTTRQLRVAELIKEELAQIIGKRFNGLVPGRLVTITQVSVSSDLGFAKVFISIFPSENGQTIVKEINKNVAQRIRYELGKTVKNSLRIVPELNFYLDDSLDEVDRIEKALKNG